MARIKAFRKGDEVVIVNNRRHIQLPQVVNVIEEVHPRGVYLVGHSGFISKSMILHRSDEAVELAVLIDDLDRLEDAREEERFAATAPIEAKYAELRKPLKDRINELWMKTQGI